MATNYPTSLDSFSNPGTTSALNSPSHAGQHSDINDAVEAVQAKRGVGDLTVGVWEDYTPTFTNITVGNGTLNARYCQINKFVAYTIELVFGSTTSFGGSGVTVTLPVTASNTYQVGNGGQVTCEDASTTDYWGTLFRYSSTAVGVYVGNAASTYLRFTSLSGSVPFTWTTGDRLVIQDFYESA